MNKKFSRRQVYGIMKEKGITQAYISEKTGHTRQWVNTIIQRGFWTELGVKKLAEVLGVSVDEITGA